MDPTMYEAEFYRQGAPHEDNAFYATLREPPFGNSSKGSAALAAAILEYRRDHTVQAHSAAGELLEGNEIDRARSLIFDSGETHALTIYTIIK